MTTWQSLKFEYRLARMHGRGVIPSLVIAWQFARLPAPF
jgi:hypothetical protein